MTMHITYLICYVAPSPRCAAVARPVLASAARPLGWFMPVHTHSSHHRLPLPRPLTVRAATDHFPLSLCLLPCVCMARLHACKPLVPLQTPLHPSMTPMHPSMTPLHPGMTPMHPGAATPAHPSQDPEPEYYRGQRASGSGGLGSSSGRLPEPPPAAATPGYNAPTPGSYNAPTPGGLGGYAPAPTPGTAETPGGYAGVCPFWRGGVSSALCRGRVTVTPSVGGTAGWGWHRRRWL